MKMLARAGLALSSLIYACPALASPVVATCTISAGGTYLPCPGVQESLPLVTANVVAPPQAVYGGTYIFGQMASSYGTVALVVLGPDNATYETIISKSSSDATGGTTIQLSAGAIVKVILSGTTGANATLTRVP